MSKPSKPYNTVGQSVQKVDGLALATGQPVFAADNLPRHTLHARILRSPHPHARIASIDISRAEALPGVHAVLCHTNVPRVAHTTAGQGWPEPSPYDSFLFDHKVRFVGDQVAAVAADSPQLADEALSLIGVEYDPLEPLLDPEEAMQPGAPILHDEPEARTLIPVPYDPTKNLAAHADMDIGNVEEGWKNSAAVIQQRYHSHYAQHCPIEPHIALAYLDPQGRLTIRSSTQVPFHARRIVAQILQIPLRQVRIIKPRIGGGFGAKQEVILEGIVGLLALRTERPVLLQYSRSEEFVSARTRHPQILDIQAGIRQDGRLEAIEMNIIMNTGAYGSHALTVACNSGSKILPLYHWQNIRFAIDSVYTSLPVGGAYRGYGATQAAFATEVMIDELAHAVGLDPLDVRRQNHIREGETSPVFAVLGEGTEGVEQSIGSCGLPQCIEEGATAIGWEKKRAAPPLEGSYRRGVGVACLMQGSSIPEVDLAAASLKMNEDGSFNLLIGATDIGTGSDTALAQIAAEVLGVPTDYILVTSSDTDLTPFDVGAYASSTTYLSGEATRRAAIKVADQICQVAAQIAEIDSPETITLQQGQALPPNKDPISLETICRYALYQKNQFQIAAHASAISHVSPPPFSAQFAEVEVDIETGFVRVLHYVAAVDCGTAINPRLAEGQIEGAVLNGISFALTEEYLFNKRGKMLNDGFNHYKIFSTRDIPRLQTILIPTHEPTGPYGAKSVSEIGINGPMPAISNAIFHATGARLRQGPFTPERVLRAIQQNKTK